MTVYELDNDNFYIGFSELTEENKDTLNYTTKSMIIGYYKPRFNHDVNDWEEGATDEEIEEFKRQEEANRPPQEPNEMEVLQAQINELKIENQKLWDTCNYLINVNLDLQETINNSSASSGTSKRRSKK